MSQNDLAERTLFERCLDLCSSRAEREKIRSLAIRLHLSETAPEWAILLLHAEGRAIFGPRPKPSAPLPPKERIERRIARLLGSAIAGGGLTALVAQHASSGTILAELAMMGVYLAWAARTP
jgi:hypothetical protein